LFQKHTEYLPPWTPQFIFEIGKTIRQWVATDFLKAGYGVNLIISQLSSERSERETIESMAGGSMEMLNIISDVDKYSRTLKDR
jgi:hypothetical protein